MPLPSREIQSARACAAGDRRKAIEFAAYLKAEQDKFRKSQQHYWLLAEAEYDNQTSRSNWQHILHTVGLNS